MADMKEFEDLGTIRGLTGTKVARVRPILLSHMYGVGEDQDCSASRLPGATVCLVEVTTGDGVTGLGETYAGSFVPKVVRELIEFYGDSLIGLDPTNIKAAYDAAYKRGLYWGRTRLAVAALSGIESALWDLCGKLANKPVYQLLGGLQHDSLPRYASGGMSADKSRLSAELRVYKAQGFVATKIRGGLSQREDLDKAQFCRDAIGSDMALAFDAVQGAHPDPWNADQAISVSKSLEGLDLLWLEEPVANGDIEGFAKCRRASNIPIAGGEHLTTFTEAKQYLDAQAFDIIQPDAAWIGGVLEMRKVCAAAEDVGVDVAVHAWGSGGSVMSNYHVAFASKNAKWLEFPAQPNPMIEAIMEEPLRVNDGRVLPPTRPGLGLVVTPEIEARFPFNEGARQFFANGRDEAA